MSILLVEDNPGDAVLIEELLSSWESPSVHITTVQRLGSALSALEGSKFDVVLLDLNLPDSRGSKTFREILTKAPEVAVLVLTSTNDETLATEAVQSGAQDYLVKGAIGRELLIKSVKYAIERKKTAAQIQRALRIEGQRALDQMEQRLRLAADAANIGLWSADLPLGSGHELLDLKCRQQHGVAEEPAINLQTLYGRLRPDDQHRVQAALQRAFNGANYEVEYRVNLARGGVRWIRSTGRCYYDSQGTPVRFDGVTVDVTERKKREEMLIRSERLSTAGLLAASLSHEINNPLAAVTNLLFLIKSDATLSPQSQKYLEGAEAEVGRVAAIAKRSLSFYRESSTPTDVPLAEVLDAVVSLHKHRMDKLGIRFVPKFLSSGVITGFPGEMRQLFTNLILNALEAMSAAGGTLRAVVAERRGQVIVSVSDTGCGIPVSESAKVFEPFFTTKAEGSGLGLWVCRSLVEKHRGTIRVHSRVGARTVFLLTLPAKSQAKAATAARAGA